MGIILDDISDNAGYRLGKKTWHTICEGGTGAAIYDGAQVGWFPVLALQKHFKNDPGYLRMLELVSLVTIFVYNKHSNLNFFSINFTY